MIVDNLSSTFISCTKDEKSDVMPIHRIIKVKNTAAVKIQSFLKGVQVRKSISVNRIDKGLVKVEINDINLIDTLIQNVNNANPSSNSKIIYFALDQKYFRGEISTTNEKNSLNIERGTENIKDINIKTIESIMINGGYYNYQKRASKNHSELATIGKMTANDIDFEFIPLPDKYRKDYGEIKFSDGSLIESAPVLTKNGMPIFSTAQFSKYRLDVNFSFDTGFIAPGELRHASDRNPRAAISLPEGRNEGIVRIVACISQRRDEGGVTLPEWCAFLTRLDRMNTPPSYRYT